MVANVQTHSSDSRGGELIRCHLVLSESHIPIIVINKVVVSFMNPLKNSVLQGGQGKTYNNLNKAPRRTRPGVSTKSNRLHIHPQYNLRSHFSLINSRQCQCHPQRLSPKLYSHHPRTLFQLGQGMLLLLITRQTGTKSSRQLPAHLSFVTESMVLEEQGRLCMSPSSVAGRNWTSSQVRLS